MFAFRTVFAFVKAYGTYHECFVPNNVLFKGAYMSRILKKKPLKFADILQKIKLFIVHVQKILRFVFIK